MMPPSPWLLARMISVTYFSDTTTSSDHTMADTTPMTFAGSSGRPLAGSNTVFIVYSGLVPMSPNTMPMAARASAGKGAWCATAGAHALSAAGTLIVLSSSLTLPCSLGGDGQSSGPGHPPTYDRSAK